MHIKKKHLYAIVKTASGKLVMMPVARKAATYKKHDKIWKDVESGLWLYKKKSEYLDQKMRDESAK